MISSAFSADEIHKGLRFTPTFEEESHQKITMVYEAYSSLLSANEHALQYLQEERGFTEQTIEQFGFGYCDRSFGKQLLHNKQGDATRGMLKSAGLLKPSGHELFYGSVLLPINIKHRVQGGYGRRLSKLISNNATFYPYHLIDEAVFFNEEVLHETPPCLLLTKSPVEAVSLIQCGFEHVISTVNDFSISEEQLNKLALANVKVVKVVVNLSTYYLQRVGLIAKQLSSKKIRCKVVALPDWQDVNAVMTHNHHFSNVLNSLIHQAQLYRGLDNEYH